MNHKRLLSLEATLFLVVLVSTACGTVQPTPTVKPTATSLPTIPRLVSHAAPRLTVNTDWLEDAGCIPSGRVSGHWDCTPASPLGRLGCEEIWVTDLLGGLSPTDPLVECVNYTGELLNKKKFRQEGCMRPYFITHVMFEDDTYQLVSGVADLQTAFAPVESTDEALSYALAATNFYAHYRQKVDPHYRYLVDELEDTHVDETTEGYLVHLFTPLRPLCGCGAHFVYAVDVLVTREGQVKETESQQVYRFDACID